jgi:hypothetical protein
MDDALDRAEVGGLAEKTVMLSFEHINTHYTYTLPSTGEEEDDDEYDETDDEDDDLDYVTGEQDENMPHIDLDLVGL